MDSGRVSPYDTRTIKDCEDHALARISTVAKGILDFAGGLFVLGGISDGVLEFGNEVLKQDIQNLPDNTEVSLPNAGPRAEGDHVTFKIAVGGGNRKSQEIESDEVILLRALSHIDVAVGVIFANREAFTKEKGNFQAAPSYSVLFKFPSRSLSYKQFLDFGIGLNIAAVDFNHDDTPELGVGLVFSAFRDYLQLGIAGYNIYQSKFYWFFGLRLPMPAATLPRASE